jgi:hypothetical protein
MIYLGPSDEGGNLKFLSLHLEIVPKPGRLVVFDQSLLHEGLRTPAVKYFARTELVYQRSRPVETAADRQATELYQEACRINYAEPERAAVLEARAFELSPLLRELLLE